MVATIAETIVAALSAAATGALTETTKTTLMNAYDTLKVAIQKRVGGGHALVKAIEEVEMKPNSEGRQKMLVEEVTKAGVDHDRELLALAEHIRQLLGEQPTQHIMVKQNNYGKGSPMSIYGNSSVINMRA